MVSIPFHLICPRMTVYLERKEDYLIAHKIGQHPKLFPTHQALSQSFDEEIDSQASGNKLEATNSQLTNFHHSWIYANRLFLLSI